MNFMQAEKEKVIEKLFEIVRDKQSRESTGHDWAHTKRVYENAVLIAESESEADLFVLKASALLHDIADHKFGYTSEDRASIIRELLLDLGVDKDTIECIIETVQNVSFSKSRQSENKVLYSLECRILQDADRLDAIGAIGIARTFAYGGHFGREIFREDGDEENSVQHFYGKLLRLKEGMHTSTGQRLAKDRHDFIVQFLLQFYKEWFGEELGKAYFAERLSQIEP